MVEPLRALGLDVLTTRVAGNKGQSDPQQLAFAAREDRVLVTSNRDDFELLHEAWITCAREWSITGQAIHAGIMLVPNGNEAGPEKLAQIINEFARTNATLASRQVRWHPDGVWRTTMVSPPRTLKSPAT